MSQTVPKAATVTSTKKVTFDPPLPGPNVNHNNTITITGVVEGNNPICRVMGLIRDHFIVATFSVDITTGVFKIIISGGLLMDDNLYVVSVWSDDQSSCGAIFLDTRPIGT